MNLQEIFNEMDRFKTIIDHELKIFEDIAYDGQDPDEQFLLAHAYSLESEMRYIVEAIEYIRRPVILNGIAVMKDSTPYIDDFELFESDIIEFFQDDEWQRADIYKINGEFKVECLKDFRKIPARIRLSQKEADIRCEL